MKTRKWAILAGAVTAALVLLIALGYGVHEITAQEPDTPPAPQERGSRMGRQGERADAARWGWQARGQMDQIAETLGLSTEGLMAELREGQSVADVAEAQGVALETVVEALLVQPRERLEQAVAEGHMSQEDADARLAEIEERISEQLQQSELPQGPADRMDWAQRAGWQAHEQMDLIAETLGLSVEDLMAELSEDQSVAEIAEAQGVALEVVVEALLVQPREHLEQAVAEGHLSQEEADERLVEMETRISERLQESGLPRERMPKSDSIRQAGRWGWQARDQMDRIAETLGLSVEDLMAELHEGQSVAEVAEAQGVVLETVVEALLVQPRERLEQAVAEGHLSQEEADARLVEIEEQISERLQRVGLPQGPAEKLEQAQRAGWQARAQVDLIAETLGLSVEDLMAELREGQSVAEVAEAQGVDLEVVVEALLVQPRERLEQAVAEGHLSQEEADERLAEIEAQIGERLQQSGLPLERGGSDRGPGQMPGMRPSGAGGRGGHGSQEPLAPAD